MSSLNPSYTGKRSLGWFVKVNDTKNGSSLNLSYTGKRSLGESKHLPQKTSQGLNPSYTGKRSLGSDYYKEYHAEKHERLNPSYTGKRSLGGHCQMVSWLINNLS